MPKGKKITAMGTKPAQNPKNAPATIPASKNLGGRPTDYKPEYAAQAEKLCQFGCTDVELADFFGVSPWTIVHWRAVYPKFSKSTQLGKAAAEERTQRSMCHRASRYTFASEKLLCKEVEVTRVPVREHVPPD